MTPTKILVLGLVSLSLFSCSLRIGDPEPEPVALQAQLQGQDCLEGAGPILDRFFSGRSNNQELDRFWGCLNQALASFSAHADGKERDSYQPQELAGFVSRFFLANRQIPDDLLQSLMVLKQALLSGSRSEITKSEIAEMGRMFGAFAAASKILLPHMPITPEALKQRLNSGKDVEPSLEAIKEAGAILLTAFDGKLGDYAFADLERLLITTSRFFSQSGWNTSWIETPLAYLSTLSRFKALLVAPPKDRIRSDDWRILMDVLPSYYSLYLRYDLDLREGLSLLQGQSLIKLVRVLDELIPLLEKALDRRPEKIVSSQEIQDLLEEFSTRGWLALSKPKTLELLNLALKRFIPDPNARGRLQISAVNLRELRNLYIYFSEGVRGLESGFRREFGGTRWESGQMLRSRANSIFSSLRPGDTLFNNELTKLALSDLLKNVNEVNVFLFPTQTIVVVPNSAEVRISFPHLQRLHYLRTANRVLLRAYGNPRSRTITAVQTKSLIRELAPIFDLFQVNVQNLLGAIDARFFEASLFLPSSDGREPLTMTEAMELESLLLSVLSQGPDLHSQLSKQCRTRGQSRGLKIDEDCYRGAFVQNIERSWRGVPQLALALAGMPQRDREDIIQVIHSFLRKEKLGSPVDKNDTQSLLQIAYYMELLFYRFDRNKDGWISENEAALAFPLFRNLIGQKAAALGRTDPAEHYKIFTYILARRKIPESLLEKLDYLNWQPDTPYAIDRVGMVTVFSALLK